VSRNTTMRPGGSRLWLGAEIELPGFGVSQESGPGVRADDERWHAVVLRVPDADPAVGEERHLDAAAVGIAGGGLPPSRVGEWILPGRVSSKLTGHFITCVSCLRQFSATPTVPLLVARPSPQPTRTYISSAMRDTTSVESPMSRAAARRRSKRMANLLTSSIFSIKTVPAWPPT
jgi:hypothetical protein